MLIFSVAFGGHEGLPGGLAHRERCAQIGVRDHLIGGGEVGSVVHGDLHRMMGSLVDRQNVDGQVKKSKKRRLTVAQVKC